MISCTEFIPAYSELFKYIDRHYGYDQVKEFWKYLFEPTGKGIPLINFVKKDGLRGAVEYWNGTLSEEAADITRWHNLEAGWAFSEMHHCPSKGRLLQLKEELGLEPYEHYCDHCDYYRAALEQAGLCWVRNNLHVDEASCQSLIYDPKKFKGMVFKDENTVKTELHSSDLEYFHRDFHSSLNMGIDYLGERYGEAVLTDYLAGYTAAVWRGTIEEAHTRGLAAIEAQILGTYRKEHAEDAVRTALADGTLKVWISYCPAVRHLRSTGREVSKWFPLSTAVPMTVFAKAAGKEFRMDRYDGETGAAEYHFA